MSPDEQTTGSQHVLHGLSQGWHLIVSGNQVIVDTTLRTLQLALFATAIAALIGVPAGAALGLGRRPAARIARGVANGLTRVPPVVSGLIVLMLVTEASPYGGGPLADLDWYSTTQSAYLAQTLLAIPIMLALTAAAVQGVAPVLIEQARAYGASRAELSRLALREARGRLTAALLVTLGVAITAIGAVAVSQAPTSASVASGSGHLTQPATLALGAFDAITQTQSQGDAAPARVAETLAYPTNALAVAYATVLLGLFVLIAAVLTWMQQSRSRWIPLLLIADGVAVARGRRPLLAGVDLRLHRGEVVVVIGPNGVGKSSLLAVLGGLLQPAAGTVTARGRVAATLQAPALARRTVAANLQLALRWWGVPRAERAGRIDEALALLRINHLADRTAQTLSGGEARRVHLARALALRSDVLLLDEPFAGLDPPTRASLLGDASTALRSADRATLVVVHDRGEAWALADRVVVLLNGGVAASGPPLDVLDHPHTPALADFLGFTGAVPQDGGAVLRVRPGQAVLDEDAPLRGRVSARLAEEDGVLCDVVLDRGRVQVRVPQPGPAIGELVGVRIITGVTLNSAEVQPSTT